MDTTSTTFTASQVADAARPVAPDFQPRTVQYWTTIGIIEPLDRSAMRHRRFEYTECIVARACAYLFLAGLGAQALKPIATIIRMIWRAPIAFGLRSPDDKLVTNTKLPKTTERLISAWRVMERARIGKSPAYFTVALGPSASSLGEVQWTVTEKARAVEFKGTREIATITIDWKQLMHNSKA